MKQFSKYFYLLFFLPFLLLSIFYLFKVPIGQTPDEPAHIRYIESIIKLGTLPDYSLSGVAHHPPLYYLILSPLYFLFNNVYVLRFVSIIFSFLNLLVIKKAMEILFTPKGRWKYLPLGVAVFCSLIPMFNFMSMAVNNDSLTLLLSSLLIYFSLLSFNKSLERKEFFLWSLIFLSAIYTKIVLWPIAFISGVTVFFTQKNKRIFSLGVFFVSLILLGSWFYHNVSLYGKWDILGWQKLREVESFLTGNQILVSHPREWLVLFFHSFWGVFGWFSIYLPLPVYSVLRKVTVLILPFFIIFLYRYLKSSNKKEKLSLLLFFSFFAVISLAIIKDNLNFFHPSGRYLFPVISIIGVYYVSAISVLAGLVSKIFFKKENKFVFYLLLFIPLGILNIISAITINNFYLK